MAHRRSLVGTADVRRCGPIAWLIAAIFRFPAAGTDIAVAVTLCPEGDTERWTRTFAGRTSHSLQRRGTGRDARLLVERFGFASFALALVVNGDRLCLIPRRWSILGVSMPRFLLPTGVSFETERSGRFTFDVEIALPLVGLAAGYRGTLVPLE